MIPFDWIYCQPDSLDEAVSFFVQMQASGKSPVYYGGGSEIITMSRAGSIAPGTVIDIKKVPECTVLELSSDKLILGTANPLNTIKERKLFPMLGTACGRVADHTNQCRITLGGNLCGTIIYRETSLPLLLVDAQVVVCGPNETRTEPFSAIFKQRMMLIGDTDSRPVMGFASTVFSYQKTAQEKIDYPLVNVTAVCKDGKFRFAFSGLCKFPFRSMEIEQVLNDRTVSVEARVDAIPRLLPQPAHTDVEGSGAYQVFVLKNTLRNLLEEIKHGGV